MVKNVSETEPSGAPTTSQEGETTLQQEALNPSSDEQESSIDNGTSNTGNAVSIKLIVFLGLLIVLGVGGYVWYENVSQSQHKSDQQSLRIEALEKQIATLSEAQDSAVSNVSDLTKTLSETKERIESQLGEVRGDVSRQLSNADEQLTLVKNDVQQQAQQFGDRLETLTDSVSNLKNDLGRTADDWSLEEAEQLLFVANQRLHLTGEVPLAIRALTLADSRLKTLADPNLIDVRKYITEEITALQTMEAPDFTGVLSAIEALSSKLDQLPLPGDLETLIDVEAVQTPQEEAGSDQGGQPVSEQDGVLSSLVSVGRTFLRDVSDLVQVEKNGKTLNPIVSNEMKVITLEKTRLILESAQIAFIRQQHDLYQERMESAGNWVKDRFVDGDKRQAWLDDLTSLSGQSSSVELPDISTSLNAIRAIIAKG